MVAFAYVDADEYIDGAMLLVVLHRGFCRLSGLACNIGGKSRHPRYGRPQDNPAEPLLLAITSHPPDPVTAPPDHRSDWGRESCRAWLAKSPIIGE